MLCKALWKIMFRRLALGSSFFSPRLITRGAFWCRLRGSADSSVSRARAPACAPVCRDLQLVHCSAVLGRGCFSPQPSLCTLQRDPSLGFASLARCQSLSNSLTLASPLSTKYYLCRKTLQRFPSTWKNWSLNVTHHSSWNKRFRRSLNKLISFI